MADIKVGDRVEITKDRDWTSEDVGRQGVVTDADYGDDLPYKVKLDDGDDVWFMDVRKVERPAPTSREAAVSRAKELLTGTDHTGADVIRMAEFLAGE